MELLTSDQMNVIDEQLPFAIDARDGGAYHPGAEILLDGDIGVVTVVHINNVPNQVALTLSAVNGSAAGLLVLDGTVHGTWFYSGGAPLSLGFEPLPLMSLVGHANDAEQGGPAALFTGGQGISLTTATAGTGARGAGGVGAVAPYRGGIGLIGESGASDFSGGGASADGVFGGQGVQGFGGTTVGDDASHWGGYGVFGAGGQLTGTGRRGGYGVVGHGGLGPSSGTNTGDVGVGVRGDGSIGVHGVATLDLNANMGSEFTFAPIAGVVASAKNIGRAFLAEFSGNTAEGSMAAVRWVGDTGVGETAVFSVEAAQNFTSIADPDFTTLLLCMSNAVSGPIRGARLEGRGRPGLSVRTFALSGITYPGIEVVEQGKPTVNVPGGFAYLDILAVTGQIRDTHYISGPTRMDRVVTSGDPAAAFAWAILSTDGSGNITLGANYGVAAINAPTTTLAGGIIDLDLNAITDGPTQVNIVPIASGNSTGTPKIIGTEMTSDTRVRIQVRESGGGAYDLSIIAAKIYLVVYAPPAFGMVASQAGYFTP